MKQKNNDRILRPVLSALFAAFVCVMTLSVQIPMPNGGYANLGDAAVLLSAWALGPAFGVAAAAIGSMLADLMTGYFLYAPATLIIKALIALVAVMVSRILRHYVKHSVFAYATGAVCGEIIMIFGYFLFEATVAGYGFAGALLNVPGNCLQAAVGVVIGVLLMKILEKPILRHVYRK